MKNIRGFTLIELILYVALVAIFVSGAILFSWDAIYGREKAIAQQVVEQNARSALARIAYEIRRAEDINSVAASSIELENGANDTTIDLNSNRVRITTAGAGPYNLTSDQVRVTGLTFAEYSSGDENSKHLNVSITVEQADSGVGIQFDASTSVSQAVELNSQFNDARQMLVDNTGWTISTNGKIIQSLTLENTGSSTITIDKIKLSWTGTSGGENVTKIEIGGVTVWTGSEGSGSTIDITDYDLTVAAGETEIDGITFDSKMDDALIEMEFTETDNSLAKSTLNLGQSLGETTCNTTCIDLGYVTGVCRASAVQCTNNSETHEAEGDQYCTGGQNEDTCCCGN